MIIECVGHTTIRQFRDYGGAGVGATLPPFGHRLNGRRAGRGFSELVLGENGKPLKLWGHFVFDICVPYYHERGPYWHRKRRRRRRP